MNPKSVLGDIESQRKLANQLARCKAVSKLDTDEEPEGWRIAYTFSELEESFRRFLDKQLPILVEGQLDDSQIHDLLLVIGDEFRHILYHIADSRFYQYLSPDGEEPPREGHKSGQA